MIQKYARILLILGMAAVMCSTVSAVSIGAEPHVTSGVDAPVCSAPCECLSLTQAMQRWGTDGYDYCSKTVCGQSANADVQYYCLHQSGSSAAPPAQAQAPGAAAPAAAGQKSPVGITTVIAAIGAVLLAGAGLRRK
jgi:hypothetical protein